MMKPGSVCAPLMTPYTVIQPCKQLGQHFLEQNGCNWIRGINVSHWHLHVGKDNCRVAGETEKGEDGEE